MGMKRPAPASTFPDWNVTKAIPVGVFPLAHQGGWDEILMVVAPLAVIGGLLWMANKRVSAQIAADEAANSSSDSTADSNGGHGGS